MPTYDFRCSQCGRTHDAVLSIGEYDRNPPTFACCGTRMERFITVAPALAINNALASERHYDGLQATDGTPIDTRAKHQRYMRERGLTTVDDFTQTWAREAKAREARMAGEDPSRKADIAQAIAQLGG